MTWWPFKKKEPVRAPPPPPMKKTVDVRRVEVILMLDDGERATFAILGKAEGETVTTAPEVLWHVIRRSHEQGFFGYCNSQRTRWIPIRRVREIWTTEWPEEVEVP